MAEAPHILPSAEPPSNCGRVLDHQQAFALAIAMIAS